MNLKVAFVAETDLYFPAKYGKARFLTLWPQGFHARIVAKKTAIEVAVFRGNLNRVAVPSEYTEFGHRMTKIDLNNTYCAWEYENRITFFQPGDTLFCLIEMVCNETCADVIISMDRKIKMLQNGSLYLPRKYDYKLHYGQSGL